jgi:hypothetical protein
VTSLPWAAWLTKWLGWWLKVAKVIGPDGYHHLTFSGHDRREYWKAAAARNAGERPDGLGWVCLRAGSNLIRQVSGRQIGFKRAVAAAPGRRLRQNKALRRLAASRATSRVACRGMSGDGSGSSSI